MTQIAVNRQIEAIKKATQEALKSKQTARKFLVDAGIINSKKQVAPKETSNKKK